VANDTKPLITAELVSCRM